MKMGPDQSEFQDSSPFLDGNPREKSAEKIGNASIDERRAIPSGPDDMVVESVVH
jgi:hypothetical protein